MFRRKEVKFILRGLIILALFFQISCQKKQGTSVEGQVGSSDQSASQVLTPEQLFEKGKNVYTANCLSCHGPDPKKDGAIGPAIWGSSVDLITTRVMSAGYPEGHKPKRTTKLMVALPHLKEQIPALSEYLNK